MGNLLRRRRILNTGLSGRPPVAEFSAPETTGYPGLYQLNDESTGNPTSWLWEINDGSGWTTVSTDQSPEITIATAGTWDVRLTATNAFGSDSETKNGYITVSPPVLLSAVIVDANTIRLTFSNTADFNFGALTVSIPLSASLTESDLFDVTDGDTVIDLIFTPVVTGANFFSCAFACFAHLSYSYPAVTDLPIT